MSSDFTFFTNIPAANNNPSIDQPNMLTNNISNNNIWQVDHVTYNNNSSGTHKQVTFINENLPAGPTDPTSVIYTNPGPMSTSTIAELFYVNQNATFLLSGMKAFAAVSTTGGSFTFLNQYNIDTANANTKRTGAGRYNFVLNLNVVTTTNWGVLVSISQSTPGIWTANYTVGPSGTLAIGINNNNSGADPDNSFTIAILQY